MRSGSKLPDIWIPEPAGIYHGLFLEVKAESPFRKDGALYADDHIKEQAVMIERLKKKGYQAMFVWSLEQAIVEFKKYMQGK
jgi:DNA-dependent RNA polymerase auxiliary subunit epsilon